jgi:hypothetical protein
VPDGKTKIALPTGTFDAVDVPVKETVERWTEIELEDGARLRVKPLVISVARVEGQFDQDGNPVYAVKGGQTLAIVSVPDNLKRRVN